MFCDIESVVFDFDVLQLMVFVKWLHETVKAGFEFNFGTSNDNMMLRILITGSKNGVSEPGSSNFHYFINLKVRFSEI